VRPALRRNVQRDDKIEKKQRKNRAREEKQGIFVVVVMGRRKRAPTRRRRQSIPYEKIRVGGKPWKKAVATRYLPFKEEFGSGLLPSGGRR